MSEALVSVVSVSKAYRMGDRAVTVLRDADLEVEPCDFIALLGPSGSGKSTLLHLLAGLTTADAGDIRVCGLEYRSATQDQLIGLRRQRIGYVFQDYRLLQGLSALENVLIPLYSMGVSTRAAENRAKDLLCALGLSERMRHLPRQMSGGEQQRVAIARALANRPSLILADEPTGNLDAANGSEIMHLLSTLPQQQGTTIIAVTHNPEFARYATRVLRVADGRLEEAAS